MKPVVIIASFISLISGAVAPKVYHYFKGKKAMAQIESEKAKEELVQRLEEYDNEHQDDEQVLAQKIEDDEYTEYDEDEFRIVKMDVDENPETPQQFGIMSIPTLLLKKDGEVVEKAIGVQSKDQLRQMIAQHL